MVLFAHISTSVGFLFYSAQYPFVHIRWILFYSAQYPLVHIRWIFVSLGPIPACPHPLDFCFTRLNTRLSTSVGFAKFNCN